MFEDLSSRQIAILEFIKKEIKTKGYPPAVREIGEAVGLNSSSTVHNHLNQLESKGYIKRDPTKPRAIEILDRHFRPNKDVVEVPLVGRVTAGAPILAVENIEETFPLPSEFVDSSETFMLRVQGDSMVNAGILDGDLVIIRKQDTARNGDIVVALLDDEATVKRFFKEDRYIRLQPENENYEPIITQDLRILGKVVGLMRKY
ncbi:MAG: transcriptional repressor LexA [Peptococcaceae bacterium]|jgi:repressor LexA|nr:transcriptional repressor LexA [Peptococcaceae bacterium]MDH7525443.1 transcriptional repressor LexA [Peptococcaceae bacterium]